MYAEQQMYLNFQILIFISDNSLPDKIKKCLENKQYTVDFANSERSFFENFNRNTYNLIICQDRLNENSGFKIFKTLEKDLIKSNTAFFMVIDDFSIEDVQLGLELGIDNFVFMPINKESLCNKIDKLYKKHLQFNYFETPRFIEHFYEAPIPMFFADNFVIKEVNSAFSSLFQSNNIAYSHLHFYDIFDLKSNQQNLLTLRKLENGLIDHCWLDNIECLIEPQFKFSMYLSIHSIREVARTLIVLLPKCKNMSSDIKNVFCDINEKCNKNQVQNVKTVDDSEIYLTPREKEIFNLSAKGVPLKQIALQLKLSQRTVEKHRSNIMSKTDSHNIIEAILKIRKNPL